MNVLVIPLHLTVIFAVPFFLAVTTPLLLTVATFLLLVLYVTLDTGAAFTLIVVFLPFFSFTEDFTSLKEGFLTLTVNFLVYLPTFTVITAFPAFLPVITPFLLIVATFLLLDLKVTFPVTLVLVTLIVAFFPT